MRPSMGPQEMPLVREGAGCHCPEHHFNSETWRKDCSRKSTEHRSWLKEIRLFSLHRKSWPPRLDPFSISVLVFLLLLSWCSCVSAQGPQQVISVVEEQPPGTLIGTIGDGFTIAQPPYQQIIFTDQSGVGDDLTIDKITGKIHVRRQLDRERRSTYGFAALSKVTSMILHVKIKVTDINDHSPAFPNATMSIELSESTPRDTKIKLSSAVDRDVGINNTQRYEIVDGNTGNAFKVSSKRAGSNILLLDLVVNSVLDYEITRSYSLLIKAYDGGTPSREGSLRVNINILDVNDYIPVFVQSHYFAAVQENATVGTSVIEVSASDQDSGENGKIRYSINRQRSDPQEHFTIEPISGIVRLNKPLDFESTPEYELIVIAQDNGTQPREGSAVISVQLININEQPAQINLVFLTANSNPGSKSGHISEKAAPGDYVARISVSDPDSPGQYNAHVNVTLSGGGGHFALTTQDNVVYLMVVDKPLDREQKPFYNLTITAVDAGVPPLFASKLITIWVDDENDNSPQFNQSVYTAAIPEASFPGVSVMQMTASDLDTGDNSLITYSLLSTPSTQSDWFQIDTRTGLITTRSNVDCEVNSQPQLTVVAADSGNPRRTGSATVVITVKDYNDNQPMFDQSYYSVIIPENTTLSSCVITVSATDPDCGVNAQVSYSIPTNLGFEVPTEFYINNITGQICIHTPLDYEEKKAYEFTVMATDKGGLNTRAMVMIQVTDVNDNKPVFYPATYNVNVNENTPVNTPIITVQASDPDSGKYGKITYILRANTEGFVISEDSGVIYVNRSLGRGERVIQLEVSAVDGEGRVTVNTATVTVSVTGANYQPPEFDMTTYNFAVAEDSRTDNSIGTVQASRASTGSAGMIYSIAAGDPQNFFRIDSGSGVLYTQRTLDHDTYPSLLLNIQAKVGSPPLFGTAQVNVTISDINDNTPEFRVPQLEIPVKENTPVSSTIYVVHATDPDSGNNGKVRYRLTVNPGGFFSIHSQTGKITLKKSLDYEVQQEFNLVVNAFDQGSSPKDSSIDFQVTVLDVNDNTPQFSKSMYNFSVSENVEMNTQFAQMNATDKDSGNNAQITYYLAESTRASKFGIFPVDGHLYIREPLDREMKSLYMLKIIAIDNGSPAKSTSTNVRIEVLDANDNSPVFSQPSYTFYILENKSSGSTVGYVTASDRDSGDMADLRYSFSLTSPNFEINHYTGEIMTKKILNREELQEAEFTVDVTDRGKPPRGDNCVVTVIIQDVNDNAPIFERSGPYVETVDENQPKGTPVTQIVANDPDIGENGTVTYSLARQGDLSALGYFTIHPKTGWIRTEEVLDYETRNSFTLHVLASDSGKPPMVSPLLVQVEVRDDNDEAPIFTSHNVTFIVVENSPLGSIVGKVIASDRDSGENGRISYYISGGNVFSAFDVNITTGEIFTVREIDYEESSSHSLGIKAVDNNVLNPKSSTVKVIINIQDVNDNTPSFDMDPVVLRAEENLLVDSYVYKFIATDPDSGSNGVIEYSIVSQSPPGPYFTLHKSKGILSTEVVLDHEEVAEVSLIVRARDKAAIPADRHETTITVIIFIDDANDNWPQFEIRADSYKRHVFEDEPIGFPVMLIVANDADSNINNSGNNEVGYFIMSGNEQERFTLNEQSGLLEIASPLDRETQDVYHLNISAYDHGTPRRTAFKRVTVNVIDVNDNSPRFDQRTYQASVSENTPAPTAITTIRARDLDNGENGELTYLIPRGLAADLFTVDEKTGVVSNTQPLDRENQSSYLITVYVRDEGYPANYDTATVIVNVTDENDHGPVFQIPSVYLVVPENEDVSIIHTLVATDSDFGKNGQITYKLIGGDINQKFQINPESGELTCAGLDRETVSQYNLTVQAQDGGSPARTGHCHVIISVTDTNDNNPVFTESSYTATIPESTGQGRMVLQITATDMDEGVNGNVTYSLGNDTEGLFRIDSTNGRITTTGTFDREKRDEYTFQVNATDGGLEGPRYGITLVNIKVSDINDNPPVFQQVPYQANISQDYQANQYVITVLAEDKDEGANQQVSYTFRPTPGSQSHTFFSIERNSGIVRTSQALNSDTLGYHNLQVLATDHGSSPLTSTGVIEIIVGSSVGLSALKFSNLTYNINLSEKSSENTVVTRVQADFTTSRSGTITYNFASGNEMGTFSINPTTGVISVRQPAHLDFETTPRIRLIIVASASGAYGYSTVWVNLLDYNDNKPAFGQDRYTSSVWEGHKRGTYVTQVIATDPDQDRNAQIRYNIIRGNTDNAFSIEPEYSGIVKTNIILDREVHPWYRLEIEAVDHGTPSLSSTCTLRISVVDVNDNKPYLPSIPPITVSEGLEIGSEIERLFASDQDLNPTLSYHFLPDGNYGNMFSIDRYNGTITLAKKLDYEKKQSYRLKIRVWDSVYEDTTEVTINVRDENDNAPQFNQQSYQITLAENTGANEAVFTVNATDPDADRNAQITYSMDIVPVDGFYINPKSGTIYTNKTISYSSAQPVIQLVVKATDGGEPPRAAVVAIRIQVTDVNNYEPRFNENKYVTKIREDLTRGSPVIKLSATDADSSRRNHNIDYKIVRGNTGAAFMINRQTGQIRLNSEVDREIKEKYSLEVMAKDRGTPPKNSTTTIKITVEDVNDSPPIFEHNHYYIELNESYPADLVFLKVSARDDDIGENGEIIFDISTGDDNRIFNVDEKTGEIKVAAQHHLDFEQDTVHKLIIQASDCKQCPAIEPKLSAFTTVVINVTDVNEFHPVFPVLRYLVSVPESQAPGKIVFQAYASDEDGGQYGEVEYSMSGDTTGFQMDRLTGFVTTTQVFNYEERTKYNFKVTARDKSGLSTTVPVIVLVESVDEYPPVFEDTEYNFSVPGNAKTGAKIGRVHATDRDMGIHRRVVYFLKTEHEYFAVNRTSGEVYVKLTFHEENQRRKRSADLSNRVRRALTDDQLVLDIVASSGQLKTEVSVDISVDRTCAGCAYVAASQESGLSGTPLVLVIVFAIVVIVLLVVIAFILLRRHYTKQAPPSEGMFEPTEVAPIPPRALPQNGHPPPYSDIHHYNLNNNLRLGHTTTTSEMSDQSHHSASSGHGSVEDGDECVDEEIRMINANNLLQSSANRAVLMPDSGIQADDTISEPSVQNHQEYLARLGIDTAKMKVKPKPQTIAQSVESMHHFSDEGGGEGDGMDFGSVNYSKMTDLETDDELAMIENSKDYGFCESDPQHAGSLSSVINSEEEYSGSYNWDYLLDWGPQYQPLADVFAEIARLKDDSVQPKKPLVQQVPQRPRANQINPPVRMIPPPMITGVPPKPLSQHLMGRSNHSSPSSGKTVTSRTSAVTCSLPRSPISHESSFTSPALTPSFTPSLSPLATGSPSSYRAPSGGSNRTSSGPRTPHEKGYSHHTLSASESEQELRI